MTSYRDLKVESVVPQAEPMVLLDRIVNRSKDLVACEVDVHVGAPFETDGRVENLVSVEWMAQAIAVYVGLIDRDRGLEPQIGYLIGIRKAEFHVDFFDAGQTLQIVARRIWGNVSLSSFDCETWDGENRLALARISVYRGDLEME